MKQKFGGLFGSLLTCVAPAILSWGFATASYANETLIYPIVSGTDDAEENIADPVEMGQIDIESSDIEIGHEKSGAETAQLAGLRFTDINIAKGTPIVSAYIQFTTDEDDKNNNPFNVTVWAEATDNAQTFTTDLNNISSRPKSSALVAWSEIADWTVEHAKGELQRTPDLKDLVQEIINRDGWAEGNAISFLLQGEGTRTAESFEGSNSHLGLNDYAPHLVIVVPSTSSFQISGSNDDAEENIATGEMDIDSSDLELGWESSDASDAQVGGLRFANVIIPNGAQILSAKIQFAQDEDKNNNPFEVTIWGEDTANASAYQDVNFNISSRIKTGSSVVWSGVPEWTVTHEAGADQQTPDLTSIVQEIVNKAEWQEGNSLAFIIAGEGTRTAESFDGTSALAPVLEVTFIGELTAPSVDKVRLSWSDDPTSTMTVIWDQLRGSNAKVLYDVYDGSSCPTSVAAYQNEQVPHRITEDYNMTNTVARLSGLAADTAYRFVIADSETVSECMWFRTAPDTPKPFTYFSGGDTKSGGDPLQAGRWSNEMVAKLRPLFVIFTGDFNSGNGTDAASWIQWLTDWSTLTKSADGRMYPIIAVHGNHEDGDFEVLYKLFDAGNHDTNQSSNYAYYALSFGGDLLRVYNLNSQLYLNGMSDAHTKQNTWFEQDLIANQDFTFKVAGYHKPMRPHTQSKSENDFLVNDWAPLYDTYDIAIAYESDTHNHVFTFPIRLAADGETGDMGFIRDDDNGTLHIGEGSWGATPRDNNDDKSWTLDSASFNQIKWNHVYPATDTEAARIEIRSIKTAEYVDGELTNFAAPAAANTEADVFAIPEGVSVRNIPFYGSYITYPFEAVDGEAPTAPANLMGSATSYFDIVINWVNTADPSLVRNIQVERRVGASGDWIQVTGNLDADATSYSEGNLSDGTDYYYRVRATNVFGTSEWSNEILIATPVDPRVKAEFQEGLDGYEDSFVIAIASASPDSTFVAEALSIDQATSDYGGPGSSHGLIKFENLFGATGIPANAIIESAQLRVRTTSSTNGPVGLYQMLQSWDGTTTWNTLLAGIQADDFEAKASADDTEANIGGGVFTYFNVTDSVLSWANGAPNYGWAIINDSTDGWDFNTETYTGLQEHRPLLTVFYTLLGDADANGVVDQHDIRALRAYMRQDAEVCPACDINGDGTISIADMRQLVMLLRSAR